MRDSTGRYAFTTRRLLGVAIAAIVLAGGAAFLLRPQRGAPSGAPTQGEMARAVGAPVMTHIHRGHVPGRSGEVLLVPRPHNFLLGEWDLTTLGTSDPIPGSSHPNPWKYLTEVPIVMMGAGVQPGRYDDVVDIADVAPTYAALLGMDDFAAAGKPLPAVDPRFGPPRAIFTVVIDGGGWNVLQEHPDAWPNIARLMDQGATYVNGTIGSAPSITGALHATFGTGLYPSDHGIPGNRMRGDEGKDVDAYLENADPRYLDAPAVSELWDERNDNRPIVGTVSYEGWHLGMIGHGAQRAGGDKDIALLWEQNTEEWWTNEEYYELPSYLQETDIERLESYEEQLDPRDGLVDDTWFGETLDLLQQANIRPGTPAFVRFTGDAVMDILSNEGIGRDALTDLFWVEMKMPDYAGHRWNMISPQEEDVLEEVDRQIGRFLGYLDREVGRDNYVFGLSADHGQQPLPDISGGWRINNKELERDIESAFGPIVQKVSTVDILIDMDEVQRREIDIDEVARFLGAYTIGDNIPPNADGSGRVPDDRLDEPLFAGAFTTDFISSLTPEGIARLGDGDFQEGVFPVTDR
jgi:predicted AlkP superfamily pyrophosphatase or phosphodiesterase